MSLSFDYLVNKSHFSGIINFFWELWTSYNEFVLNIDTRSDNSLNGSGNVVGSDLLGAYSNKSKHRDSKRYTSPDYWNIRKVASILETSMAGDDVFEDLGSGKGRILCVMARRPFKKVVGIELSEHLCAAAKRNAGRLRGRKAEIDIICEDAARADLTEGTVYFMYNPFGPDTMRDIMNNIRKSLLENPRKVIIVYYHAEHEDILRLCEWLQMFHHFSTFTKRRVSFWTNRMS